MNTLLDKAREGFLRPWIENVIKAVLVAAMPNIGSAEFLSDIPSSARLGTSDAFRGKTVVNGVADAEDITFSNVSKGTALGLVIYQVGNSDDESPLIVTVDSLSAGEFPMQLPKGADLVIRWADGPDKIFRL